MREAVLRAPGECLGQRPHPVLPSQRQAGRGPAYGPSRFLPDAAGLFRFRDVEEAARCLEAAAADYERQSRQARALAEEFFDAPKVAKRVLERALA